MLRMKLVCICILVAVVFLVFGCKSKSSSIEKKNVPVDISESRKLAVVSTEFLSPEMEEKRYSSMQSAVEFAKNGSGVVYVEPFKDKYRVVHDGQAGKSYLDISELSISSDGRRVAYVAHISEGLYRMVVDGREGYDFGADDNHWFTPDGKHHISTIAHDGGKYLVIDNKIIHEYRIEQGPELSSDSLFLAFSAKSSDGRGKQFIISDIALENKKVFNFCGEYILPNDDKSRIAVGCLKEGKNSVKVIDFQLRTVISENNYDGAITHMRFSPYNSALSYTLYFKKENQRYVVYNGKEENTPFGDEFMTDPLVFSDPEAVGVIIGDVYKVRLYRAFRKQNKNGKIYGYISDLVTSKNGRHHAYIATNVGDAQMHIVVNGHEGPKFDKIVSPIFSPDGHFLVYRARQAGKRFLVVSDLDGKVVGRHRDYDMVFQPAFIADGTSLAYGVLDGNELWWKVEKLAETAVRR